MKMISTMALGFALALAGTGAPALAKDKPAKEGQIKISEKVQPIAGIVDTKTIITFKAF